MKKSQVIKLVIILLIVIAIIVAISKISGNKNKENQKLADLSTELKSSQTYLFEIEKDSETKTIMAKKDNKTIIDHYSEGNHSTTIVKDNNTYLVLHDREEYYVYEGNTIEQDILTEGLGEVALKEFTTGTEKVKGKKYYYEEFQGTTMFIMANSLEGNEEEVKTRFYFDNDNNLVYIRTIKGSYQELLKINIQKEVDDSTFEIPSHYAEG